MPRPFNYSLNIPDPTSSVMQMMPAIQAIQQMKMMQQMQPYKQAAAAAQVESARQLNDDIKNLGSKPTPEAVANLSAKHPVLSDKFEKTYNVLNIEQQKAHTDVASQVYASLLAGKPEVAQEVLTERIEALKNSGDEEQAKTMETMLKLIQLSPDTALISTGVFLSTAMGKDKFIETFTKLEESRRKRALEPGALKKQAADLGLTEAQTNKVLAENKKLGVETKKAILELEALKKGDIVDPEKKFEQERKLSNEYTNRTKSFIASQDAFNKIKASADQAKSSKNPGPSDIALVTSFMKMLDPGSVVRETEFATARDTAGLLTRLGNTVEKIQTGGFLDNTQRQEFVSLANQYMEAAIKQENVVRTNLEKVVKNYKLNPENVFPTLQKQEPLKKDTNKVTVDGQTFERPSGFTDAQWQAYKQSVGAQ